MIADGAEPEKVWIYGNLHVVSRNKPNCNVHWGWHVAPIVEVATGAGIQTWVVDPSLFVEPVPLATWVNVQGDPNATVALSTADIFHRTKDGYTQTDPTYAKTQQVLFDYRSALKLRSASADGPPPYFACMTTSPGVQWFGSIGPNQARRWFTWGWGASWHVVWTIMPLTPCPGTPQLSWSVEVERASPTQCTYWIAVRNLTSDPVKFEGRYDVLSW